MGACKEGMIFSDIIFRNRVRIFPDAADFGAPFNKGDEIFKAAASLANFEGIEGTKKESIYATGQTNTIDIEIMHELTCQKKKFRLTVVASRKPFEHRGKKYTGYVYLDPID